MKKLQLFSDLYGNYFLLQTNSNVSLFEQNDLINPIDSMKVMSSEASFLHPSFGVSFILAHESTFLLCTLVDKKISSVSLEVGRKFVKNLRFSVFPPHSLFGFISEKSVVIYQLLSTNVFIFRETTTNSVANFEFFDEKTIVFNTNNSLVFWELFSNKMNEFQVGESKLLTPSPCGTGLVAFLVGNMFFIYNRKEKVFEKSITIKNPTSIVWYPFATQIFVRNENKEGNLFYSLSANKWEFYSEEIGSELPSIQIY